MKTIKLSNWNERPYNYTGIVEYPNGNKHWLLNGEHHRENGPAIEWASGDKSWFLNGKRYLEDGYKTEMMGRSSTLGKLIFNKTDYNLEET